MQMTVPLTVVTVFSVIFHTFSMNLPSESGKTTTFLIKVQEPVKVSKVTSVGDYLDSGHLMVSADSAIYLGRPTDRNSRCKGNHV